MARASPRSTYNPGVLMPAKFLVLRDIANLDRLYEPFIIAHDFAYTFDLEMDTSRKKHAHKKSPASGPEATLHGRWSSLWSKLNAWINLSSPRFGQISESSSQKRQLIVVTVRIPRSQTPFSFAIQSSGQTEHAGLCFCVRCC